MGKSKKATKRESRGKRKPLQPVLIPEPEGLHLQSGRSFNAPMPDRRFVCDLCGGTMYESHCKIICQYCGYIRDCSDP